jgi:hypothetical protein
MACSFVGAYQSFDLTMEAIHFSETLVITYKATRRHGQNTMVCLLNNSHLLYSLCRKMEGLSPDMCRRHVFSLQNFLLSFSLQTSSSSSSSSDDY